MTLWNSAFTSEVVLCETFLLFPYYRYKSYWSHQDKKNIYFLQYENMKGNRRAEIKKLASFLGKNLKDHDIDFIENQTSFLAMKNNPSTNYSYSGK